MTDTTPLSMVEQIASYMREHDALASLVPNDRVLTTPLKRPGSNDPELIENEETPQCFSSVPPFDVLPSIVVTSGMNAATGMSSNTDRYISMPYTIAYYAGLDDYSQALWAMRMAAMKALFGKVVMFDSEVGARLRPVNDLSSIVPIPEFELSGWMMIERVRAIGVWRRH